MNEEWKPVNFIKQEGRKLVTLVMSSSRICMELFKQQRSNRKVYWGIGYDVTKEVLTRSSLRIKA